MMHDIQIILLSVIGWFALMGLCMCGFEKLCGNQKSNGSSDSDKSLDEPFEKL